MTFEQITYLSLFSFALLICSVGVFIYFRSLADHLRGPLYYRRKWFLQGYHKWIHSNHHAEYQDMFDRLIECLNAGKDIEPSLSNDDDEFDNPYRGTGYACFIVNNVPVKRGGTCSAEVSYVHPDKEFAGKMRVELTMDHDDYASIDFGRPYMPLVRAYEDYFIRNHMNQDLKRIKRDRKNAEAINYMFI